MDWKNVDLNSPYERGQNILDGYSFNTLLLEIACNIPEITRKEVVKQFEYELNNKISCARDVFYSNLNNIVKKAIEERNNEN